MPEDYWILASSIFDHQIEEEYQGTSISSRILSYKAAFQMFLDYPLTGVGLYNFQFNAVRYGAMYNMVVHNTYLEILTGGGLLGLIPFSLLLINNWRMLKLKISYDKSILDLLICLKASFVSILITSYFISGDHKKILWLLFAFISSVHYLAENQCRLRARGVKLI